jgi:hypothetical protein
MTARIRADRSAAVMPFQAAVPPLAAIVCRRLAVSLAARARPPILVTSWMYASTAGCLRFLGLGTGTT